MTYHKPLERIKSPPSPKKELREFSKNINIELIYGASYLHTPTGLVDRGIKTLKDYMRANHWGRWTMNEALSCSLNGSLDGSLDGFLN